MRARHCVRVLLIVALGVLTAACDDSPPTSSAVQPPSGAGADAVSLGDETWVLTEGVVAGEEIVQPDDFEATLRADGDIVRGTAFCNGYGVGFSLEGRRITFDQWEATAMACEVPGVMEAEEHFLEAFEEVETVARDGTALVLSGPDTSLRFRAAPDRSAPSITATRAPTGDPALPEEVLLTLRAEGPAVGDGQRTAELGPFAYDYVLQPGEFGLYPGYADLPPDAVRRPECIDDGGCQPALDLAHLPSGTYDIADEDPDVDLFELDVERVPGRRDIDVAGEWRLQELSVDGEQLPVDRLPDPITLELRADDPVAYGTAVCNGYSAVFMLYGDMLSAYVAGSTEVGCGTDDETLDRVGRIVDAYDGAFSRVDVASRNRDTLILSSEDVRMVFTSSAEN